MGQVVSGWEGEGRLCEGGATAGPRGLGRISVCPWGRCVCSA